MKKYLLALICACMVIPAFAQTDDAPFSFYSATVDSAARTVTFNIGYLTPQSFDVNDGNGLPLDSFQLWADPNGATALQRAEDHLMGTLTGSYQLMISMRPYLSTGLLQAVAVESTTYAGARTADGWGSDAGTLALSVTSDHAAHVTVPFSLLHTDDGHVFYSFAALHDGSIQYRVLDGVSGVVYDAPFLIPVPEPSTGAMAAVGVLMVLLTLKHSKRAPRLVRSRLV